MDRHRQTPWHALKLTEVYETLHTSEEGLGDAEAAERLKKHGRNELRSKPPKTILQMLKAQIVDPMVLILIGAAVFSAILQEWTEAAVIFVIVIVNAVIGIVQEKKAQSSLEALRNMSAPTARVLRQGEESVIPASDLVVGDVVMLGDGDMVPADLRLIDSANLKVQEASLTGESVPSEKEAEDLLPEDCPLGDRSNMAYTSAIVTYGRATGVVVATGMDTEVGNIAGMLDNQDDTDTPLKRKLNAVGKTLTIVGLIVCALIFAIGAFYQRPLIPQFLVAISLAISIIPEGLPATATIVMALGVQRMAKKNALIRKLPAVETLGSATVICSDKTGTLTLNKMTVTHIAVNGDFENGTTTPIENAAKQHPAVYKELVYAAALCNDASLDPDRKGEIIGDPTEGALIYMAQAFGIDHEALEDEYPRFFEQPFDSERKRMTTVHRINEKWISYTKGAVDEMLPLCTHILTSEGVRPITEADKENITKLCLSMSEGALRVLGFAMRTLTELPNEQFALPVKSPDVFLFEEAFHAFLLQVADGRQAVHGVAGKAADRLGDDQINLSVQRVLYHLLEAFAVLDACAGNTFIGVYAAELPIGVAFDEVCVVVHLRLIAGQLFLVVSGDPGVSGDAPFAGSRYGHRGIAGQRGGDFRYLWHFCFAHLSSIICRLRSRASGVQHS